MSETRLNLLDVEYNACCDVCDASTRAEVDAPPFTAMVAGWETSRPNEGERYFLNLCRPCFFMILATLKRQRMVNTMFNDTAEDLSCFGMVNVDDANSIATDVTKP